MRQFMKNTGYHDEWGYPYIVSNICDCRTKMVKYHMRSMKIQTAVAEAATARIIENVLRDIHPDKKFKVVSIQLWAILEAAVLHEFTMYRNRSTGPGPVSGALEPVEYEGQFFQWVEHAADDYNIYWEFPGDGIDFDKDDGLTVRFDTGTQGGGQSCAMEALITYTTEK